jgi:hypothetical protein
MRKRGAVWRKDWFPDNWATAALWLGSRIARMLYVCSIEEVEALCAQARRVGRVDAGRGVL